MLWLIVLLLIGSLTFVIFHKPAVNTVGAGWTPPRLDPPAARTTSFDVEDAVTMRLARDASASSAGASSAAASSAATTAEDAVTAPVVRQEMPDTFNFNDLFGGAKDQGPTDRPNA